MNKGLSELLVVVFLMLIGISLTAVAYFWSQGVVFNVYPNETQDNAYMRQRACLNIQDINETYITINNCGSVPLDRFYLYINDIKEEELSNTIPKLNPSEKYEIPITKSGTISVYITSNYAESAVMTYDTNILPFCGDGQCIGTEACSSCPSDCGICPVGCNNGEITSPEICDDGNNNNCDGCSADCSRVDKVCGDGILECDEQCDDGNHFDGDGCSYPSCNIEDLVSSIITIISPANDTLTESWFWANVTTNEPVSSCSVSMNGTANQIMANSFDNWNLNITGISDGSHNVKFLCVDIAGNIGVSELRNFTIIIPILPNSNPIADFSFVITDTTVQFTDKSTDSDGSIASWVWTFGTAGTSSSQNPIYTYPDITKSYTVKLTVTDNGGATSSISKTVSISSCNTCLTSSDCPPSVCSSYGCFGPICIKQGMLWQYSCVTTPISGCKFCQQSITGSCCPC